MTNTGMKTILYTSLSSLVIIFDYNRFQENTETEVIKVLLSEKFKDKEKVYDLITLWLVGNHTKEYEYCPENEDGFVEDKIQAFTDYLLQNYETNE